MRAWLLASGVFLASSSASAFCRTTVCKPSESCPPDQHGCPSGQVIAWPRVCVSYSLQYRASRQVDLETATKVVEKAFAAWQEVQCPGSGMPPSIAVAPARGTVACTIEEYNQTDGNANIIVFRDDNWESEDHEPSALALTTVHYNSKTGDIYDVDMEINGQYRLSTSEMPGDAYDLQSVVTHEAGHFLGLAHSEEADATMYLQYSSGSVAFRDLSDDDIAGICAIYPPERTGVCDFEPRKGFSPECGIYPTQGGRCSVSREGTAVHDGASIGALTCVGLCVGLLGARRRRFPAVR